MPGGASDPGADRISSAAGGVGFPIWHDQGAYMDRNGGPPYYDGAAAYDPLLGEVVYYGGCYYWTYYYYSCTSAATWIYNGTQWSNATASLGSRPPAVFGEGLVWDPAFGAVLMVGGDQQTFGYISNNTTGYIDSAGDWTWEFQGTGGWVNITGTVGTYYGVVSGSVAYDDALHEVVLVGGCAFGSCPGGWEDYWVLGATGGWRDAGSAPTIGGGGAWLREAAMAYDPTLQEMVLFGGRVGNGYSNATFALTASGWSNVTLTSGTRICFFVCFKLYPNLRAAASMTWDGQIDVIVLNGGYNATSFLNDTWYLTANGTWIPSGILFSVPGPATAYAAMPSNSSDIAPLLVAMDCAYPYTCFNESWVLESQARPVIYSATPNPLDPAQLDVDAGVQPGTGSGPQMSWTIADDAHHATSGAVRTVDFATNVTFSGELDYQASGTYNVSVNVSDFFGVENSTYTNVTVIVPVSALPTASPSPTEVGVPVAFTPSAIGGVPPYSYRWGFGDGTPLSLANVSTHTYDTAGSYVAWVNVTDTLGAWANASVPIVVHPELSVAPTGTPGSTDLGATIAFDAQARNGSGTVSSYAWQFGDGTDSSASSPTHLYTATGSYLVRLTVVDSLGVTANGSTIVSVNAAPVVFLSASTLNATTTEPDQFFATPIGGTAPYSYRWTFGDGGVGTGRTPSHTFASAGSDVVDVTLTDARGAVATASLNVTVQPEFLVSVLATPAPTEVGVPVSFSTEVSGGVGGFAYRWGFGDPSPVSTLASPAHAFAAAGAYVVWVNVTDADDVYVNASTTVTVVPALEVVIRSDEGATDVGVPVAFQGEPQYGSGSYVAYAWSFGDGAVSSAVAPAHAYEAAGAFSVSLTVTDSLGAVAEATVAVTANPLPSVSVAASSLTPGASASVEFTANADAGTSPYAYAWTFGDGASASGGSTTHAYAATGTYTVTVTITDSVGVTAATSVTERVQAGGSGSGGAAAPSPWTHGSGLYVLVGAPVAAVGVGAAVLWIRRVRPPV